MVLQDEPLLYQETSSDRYSSAHQCCLFTSRNSEVQTGLFFLIPLLLLGSKFWPEKVNILVTYT